jgi:hypothetical protein
MKNPFVKIAFSFILLSMSFSFASGQVKTADLVGAWQTGKEVTTVKIYSEQNFAIAIYNLKDKQFTSTAGGRWTIKDKNLVETIEFHSSKPDEVGKEISIPAEIKNGKLTFTPDGKKEEWSKLDSGEPGQLAGAWLITGRMSDGQFNKMTPGARRTMKILSGTRFQWIAYNTDTKEFFGTGGGTYTTVNGKYTENIEFFSRDNNRVGASLQFDFTIEDGNWHHKGLSSKGDPIDEVWTKREKTGL